MIVVYFLFFLLGAIHHEGQAFVIGGTGSSVSVQRSKSNLVHTELHLVMSDMTAVVSSSVAAVVLVGAVWMAGSDDRTKRAKYKEWEKLDSSRKEERARLAFIAPREEPWTEEELREYDGTRDPDGPILIGVAGKVYNVWKGRHFYGPGGEYSIFAGRDATRLLAKFRTEEEDEASLSKPLTMGERATLEGYLWTFNDKYEVIGTLAGFNPKDTAMW